MKFGIREICDVVLRAKSYQTLGNRKFYKNEPVLYFDTLKTSSLEGAATTVYAQGGHGNARLVAWEGERTLTFTMEDALLSMESFSILSGAGLLDASKEQPIYIHQTSQVEVKVANTIELPDYACWNKSITLPEDNSVNVDLDLYEKDAADIFVMVLKNGEVNAEPCIPVEVEYTSDGKSILTCYSHEGLLKKGSIVLVDYYVMRTGGAQMIEITADKFGGNYYLEASTLFRRESDGVDMPAEFIIPNCKVQSNFTFSLAATGDPSTFTFTMDAFPDYTKFDQTHKVLAAIQVISDESGQTEDVREPCEEKLSTYSDKVEVEFVKNGRTAAEVEATGTCSDKDYEESVFGSDIAKGSELIINFPVEADERSVYTIIQTNPGLVNFTGNGVEGTVKTKTYSGKDLEEGYGLLLTEESAQTADALDAEKDITVEITGGNNFHKIYTIRNFVDFSGVAGTDGKTAGSTATTYSARSYKTLSDDE